MKTLAIIQARMSSSRLPEKVLMKIGKMLVLERIVQRLGVCSRLDGILVATSQAKSDDPIAAWCAKHKINLFRGSLTDVLDRYCQAAIKNKADTVVRITGDCPLIDPFVVDEVIRQFYAGDFDAVGLHGSFPDGLDCQVFNIDAIKLACIEATTQTDREHVGSYIENTRPDLFSLGNVELFEKLGHHRWTLDQREDLNFLTLLIEGLEQEKEFFYTQDILSYLTRHPHLLKINGSITRNETFLNSPKNENKNE